MTIQQIEYRAMCAMARMTNREFYGYGIVVSAINAAKADDAAATIYSSRIDGCLLWIEGAP